MLPISLRSARHEEKRAVAQPDPHSSPLILRHPLWVAPQLEPTRSAHGNRGDHDISIRLRVVHVVPALVVAMPFDAICASRIAIDQHSIVHLKKTYAFSRFLRWQCILVDDVQLPLPRMSAPL